MLFSISAIGFPHMMPDHEPAPTPVPTPTPEIVRDEGPYHATIEYGTPEVIKHNNGPLFTYIRFPQGGNPTDEFITEWATGLYDKLVMEFNSVLASDSSAIGEVNVHFDSYLVDNRYAGIFENGEFSYSLTTQTEVVVKTFNIDLLRNILLDTTDILDYSQSESILSLLHNRILAEHPETDRYLDFIDESWLYHLVIGHKGIIVVLERYMFLPESFDTLTVTLPYEDLGSALLIRTEPPLDAVPTPVPTPDPETPASHPDTSQPDDFDPDDFDPDDFDPDDPDADDPDAGDPDPGEEHHTDTTPTDVPPQTGSIDPSKPMIALSFDDGPGVYTNEFLDLFEQYGVRATFCTIGNLVNTQKDALNRAVSMGCEVIGHSWDHKNLAKLSADAVRKQITDTSNTIHSVTGVTTPAFRPPYGAVSDTMKQVSAELGYTIIYWSVDPEDWNTKDADAVYNAVMHNVKNGSIILSHEIYKSTLAAYKRLIPDLLSQGYQIVTVSELLHHKYGDLTPGHVYYDGYDG